MPTCASLTTNYPISGSILSMAVSQPDHSVVAHVVAYFAALNEALSEALNDVKAEVAALRIREEVVKNDVNCRQDWCVFCNQKNSTGCVDGRGTAKPTVRFHQVTPEDVDWCKRQGAFPRLRVSAANRAAYEAKLLRDVSAYREKDKQHREAARALKKAGDLYWEFCLKFEFPKQCDEKKREQAAAVLLKTVPRDVLESLTREAAFKGVLEGSYKGCPHQDSCEPAEITRHKGPRHYVLGKRGNGKVSCVRQQDLNLSMGI